MKLEIERKFLVRSVSWRSQATSCARLAQGYLANTRACSIRVRHADGRGWLSVKGMQAGRSRPEYEYVIPERDAQELLCAFAGAMRVEKVRHFVPIDGRRFEVDEFQGENQGLVLAEIELPSADAKFPLPDWLGDEVTDDARFYNFRLAEQPFSGWGEADHRAAQAGLKPPGGSP